MALSNGNRSHSSDNNNVSNGKKRNNCNSNSDSDSNGNRDGNCDSNISSNGSSNSNSNRRASTWSLLYLIHVEKKKKQSLGGPNPSPLGKIDDFPVRASTKTVPVVSVQELFVHMLCCFTGAMLFCDAVI